MPSTSTHPHATTRASRASPSPSLRFKKQILKPGKYAVVGLDGSRQEEEISKERISHWVRTFQEMRKRGIRLPAPWGHHLGVVAGKSTEGSLLSDPRANAGFWRDLWQTEDGELWGELEVYSQEDANKVGTVIQEVSPFVKSSWTDGLGNSYQDAVLHIALCTNPVVPGQSNFIPSSTPSSSDASPATGMALSLSGWQCALGERDDGSQHAGSNYDNSVGEDSNLNPFFSSKFKTPTGSLSEALSALKSLGLELPEDTTVDNFLERLCVAARALLATTRKQVSLEDRSQLREEPTPLVMSHSPSTTKSSTSMNSDQHSRMSETSNASADAYILYASKLARKSYEQRINALKSEGKLSDDFHRKRLQPLLDGFQLSLNSEGEPIESSLDVILEALEALPSNPLLSSRFRGAGGTAGGAAGIGTGNGWMGSHGGAGGKTGRSRGSRSGGESTGNPPDGDSDTLDPDSPDYEETLEEIVSNQLRASGYHLPGEQDASRPQPPSYTYLG
jgi:hypothetical protein